MATTPPLTRPWLVIVCAVCRARGNVLYRAGARRSAAITQERRSRWERHGELVTCPKDDCRRVAGMWWDLEVADDRGGRLQGPVWDRVRVARTRALVHEQLAGPDARPWWRRWFVARA